MIISTLSNGCYDFSNEMKGILISLESVNGFLVYDEKLVLVSYAISNGEDGYNLFNKESCSSLE